jgi:hypothetical protein
VNANEQIQTLTVLLQPAAAWLAGLSARCLRDAADLRRAADGTYDGRDVVSWAARRIPRPELTDDELERLTLVAEHITPAADTYLDAMVQAMEGLKAKYGEQVLLSLFDLVLSGWREQVEAYRRWEADPLSQRQAAELERREAEEEAARIRLDIAVTCEYCSRLRRGPKWVNAKPPRGFAVIKGLCPTREERECAVG